MIDRRDFEASFRYAPFGFKILSAATHFGCFPTALFLTIPEIITKNVPRLECKKCSFYYSAEPFQEQKTEIFQKHLKSLPFLSVTIEYKSMIDYVDRVLLNQNNN